ncbi:hypothetical protein CXG81DRAFT_10847, partial [Caulochytrium protostelioides]
MPAAETVPAAPPSESGTEISTHIETASQFSELGSVPADGTAAPKVAASYTCLACRVAFYTALDQRSHMRTDWHRYNLLRKGVELPPVTAEMFAEKSFAAAGAGMSGSLTEDTASMVSGGYLRCKPCRKNFNTENALMNHEASKKHRECVATDEAESPSQPRVQVESGPRRDWAKELALAESEEELYRLYDEKIAASVKLDPVHDCLFCVHASEDISANIEHMVKVHSFFIPYLDHVVDVEGLLSYLGKKMAGATTCLQCNGAGRALHTLEAVRKHMIDKGHCSI